MVDPWSPRPPHHRFVVHALCRAFLGVRSKSWAWERESVRESGFWVWELRERERERERENKTPRGGDHLMVVVVVSVYHGGAWKLHSVEVEVWERKRDGSRSKCERGYDRSANHRRWWRWGAWGFSTMVVRLGELERVRIERGWSLKYKRVGLDPTL